VCAGVKMMITMVVAFSCWLMCMGKNALRAFYEIAIFDHKLGIIGIIFEK
jgi:hypothetical protein